MCKQENILSIALFVWLPQPSAAAAVSASAAAATSCSFGCCLFCRRRRRLLFVRKTPEVDADARNRFVVFVWRMLRIFSYFIFIKL